MRRASRSKFSHSREGFDHRSNYKSNQHFTCHKTTDKLNQCPNSSALRCFVDRSAIVNRRAQEFEAMVSSLLDKLGQSATDRQMATEMNLQNLLFAGAFGATRRIRTDDLLITNG
jgi:hypothetical protein